MKSLDYKAKCEKISCIGLIISPILVCFQRKVSTFIISATKRSDIHFFLVAILLGKLWELVALPDARCYYFFSCFCVNIIMKCAIFQKNSYFFNVG
jgi:hypothetical protein